uniref:Secreted protein n=1 Tax=Acrobeloides nanus TaxID=290746 RepID=A0A914DAP9_9BILA
MAALSINTLLQALGKVIHRAVNHILGYFVPCRHQTLFQGLDRLVGFCARLGLQDAPDAVVHHVRIRWPLAVVSLGVNVDVDDLREDVLDQVRFRWILPLIFRLLAGVRAVLGRPLLGLSS